MQNNKIIFDFLKKLVANNNREWFNAHKDEYQEALTQFQSIVAQLIDGVTQFDATVAYLTPKDCIYRIYRDLRFSPDKTPYKGHFGAYLNQHGKQAPYGGYYIQIEPGKCLIGGGVWYLPHPQMHALRLSIVNQKDRYRKIVEQPDFKRLFTIGDDYYKRIPNGLPKDFPYPEYLLCKNYLVAAAIPEKEMYASDSIDKIVSYFKLMQPFNTFMQENIEMNAEDIESMKDVLKFL